MGHGSAIAASAPQLEPPEPLESGDDVVEFEGDAKVAPEVEEVPD